MPRKKQSNPAGRIRFSVAMLSGSGCITPHEVQTTASASMTLLQARQNFVGRAGRWVPIRLGVEDDERMPALGASSLALLDLPLLLDVGDGALHGNDPLSIALRPELGELGAEQQDHRRVVDPDQHERERAGRAVHAARISLAEVEADHRAAEHEQERRAECTGSYGAPAGG